MIKNVFDTSPYYINAEGIKWWVDEETNQYILTKQSDRPALPDIRCWFVEHIDKSRFRVLVENGKVIYESSNWESVLFKIDTIKLSKVLE